MKKNEKHENKSARGWTMVIVALLVVVIAIIAVLLLGGGKVKLPEIGGNIIDLPYDFSITIPGKYADIVEHTQEQYGNCVTDAFVLQDGEADVSLYCISFGDRESGDFLGELNIDNICIPVTYTIFSPDEQEMEKLSEEGQAAYDALRDKFSSLLNDITGDPRFVMEQEIVEPVLGRLVEMTYWDVNLVEAITVEESNLAGIYQADFFGGVKNEKVMLYSVRIGGDSLQTALGLFEINGEKKQVSVESYDLQEMENWSDEDYSTAYRMMDTINDVIDAIMQSKHFSVEAE